MSDAGAPAIALGVDRVHGIAWLGLASLADAAAVAIRLAHAFIAVRPDARARMRDLSEAALVEMQAALAARLSAIPAPPGISAPARPLGKVMCNGAIIAAGFAAPFGRIEAPALRAVADAALALGITILRVSPWRALYAPVPDARAADALLDTAAANGLIVDAADPLLAVDACPGAQGCRSTALDTRAAARLLAPLLAGLGCSSCHVSGCAKGCARSGAADLVLVGAGDRFGLLRRDTAQGQAQVFVPPARLSELPDILKTA